MLSRRLFVVFVFSAMLGACGGHERDARALFEANQASFDRLAEDLIACETAGSLHEALSVECGRRIRGEFAALGVKSANVSELYVEFVLDSTQPLGPVRAFRYLRTAVEQDYNGAPLTASPHHWYYVEYD